MPGQRVQNEDQGYQHEQGDPQGIFFLGMMYYFGDYLEEDPAKARELFEREFIKRKLIQNSNNVANTAKVIGVQRNYLYKKIKNLKLADILDATS